MAKFIQEHFVGIELEHMKKLEGIILASLDSFFVMTDLLEKTIQYKILKVCVHLRLLKGVSGELLFQRLSSYVKNSILFKTEFLKFGITYDVAFKIDLMEYVFLTFLEMEYDVFSYQDFVESLAYFHIQHSAMEFWLKDLLIVMTTSL